MKASEYLAHRFEMAAITDEYPTSTFLQVHGLERRILALLEAVEGATIGLIDPDMDDYISTDEKAILRAALALKEGAK